MNESAPQNPAPAAPPPLDAARRTRRKSVRLAWAITICEAVLLAAAAIVLMDYWLMLPVRIRVAGVAGLGGLALFGVWRLVRFYRK